MADVVCGDLRATRRRCRASLGRRIPAGEELTLARWDEAAWVEPALPEPVYNADQAVAMPQCSESLPEGAP